MTTLPPAAMALTMSPEYFMPPSAMMGTPYLSAISALWSMAVICGTPMPETTRVGAYRAGAYADLDAVRAGLDEGLGALGGGDVAGYEADLGEVLLHERDAAHDVGAVAVGGVEDEGVHARGDQRARAVEYVVRDAYRGGARAGGRGSPSRSWGTSRPSLCPLW